ncbi:hypothetical protein GGI15_002419, partial [Coemansia interrupta]
VDVFVQRLAQLTWRRLGQLLVLLCDSLAADRSASSSSPLDPLDVGGAASSSERGRRRQRCGMALSCTVQHMASAAEAAAGPVDAGCVRRAFALLVECAAEAGEGELAHQAAKAAAMALGSGRFDDAAVLDGVAGDKAGRAAVVLGLALGGRTSAYAARVLRSGAGRRLARRAEESAEAGRRMLGLLASAAERIAAGPDDDDDALLACLCDLVALAHVRRASDEGDRALAAVAHAGLALAELPAEAVGGRRWATVCRVGAWVLAEGGKAGAGGVQALCMRMAAVAGRRAWDVVRRGEGPDGVAEALRMVARVLGGCGGDAAAEGLAFAAVGRVLGGRVADDGVAACTRVLAHVRTRHATLQATAPAGRPGAFCWSGKGEPGRAVAQHVFAETRPAAEEEEEDEEEARGLRAEQTVARVFCAADRAAGGEDGGGARVVAVCVRWLAMLATAACDGAARQEDMPGGVRVVGTKARARRAPTDWARLQRAGELRRDAGGSEEPAGAELTYAPAAGRVLRVLAAAGVLAACAGDQAEARRVLHAGLTCSAEDADRALAAARRLPAGTAMWGVRLAAALMGVRAGLWDVRRVDALRMPHAYARRTTPGHSCEALARLACRELGGLLMHPRMARRACAVLDGTTAGQEALGEGGRGLLAVVEMAGMVVRHGGMRGVAGEAAVLGWWAQALAAAAQRLSGGGGQRLAVLVAAVLLASLRGVALGDPAVRALCSVARPAAGDADALWLHKQLAGGFDHPPRACSVLPVVLALAMLPWAAASAAPGADDAAVGLRWARDACGAAWDAVHVLRRLAVHATPWLDLCALHVDAAVGRVLGRLAAHDWPPLMAAAAAAQRAHEEEEEAAEQKHRAAAAEEQPLSESSALVDRLLVAAAELRAGPRMAQQAAATQVYSAAGVAAAWTEYSDGVCALAAQMVVQAVGRGGEDQGASLAGAVHVRGSVQARPLVGDALGSSSVVPFRLLLPMVRTAEGRRGLHRVGGLWDALERAFPAAEVVQALGGRAGAPPALRACLLAALVLPPVARESEAALRAGLSAVASVLMRRAAVAAEDAAVGVEGGVTPALCKSALQLLAWRHHASVLRCLRRCSLELSERAARALQRFVATNACPAQHVFCRTDPVRLSGRNAGGAAEAASVSRALLTSASPVFAAMLTGGFAESREASSAVVMLDCAHGALAAMVDMLERLALLAHAHGAKEDDRGLAGAMRGLTGVLRQVYGRDTLAQAFELAVYYDVGPVLGFLACMVCWDAVEEVEGGGAVGCLVGALAEDWDAVFGGDEGAAGLVRQAACAIVALNLHAVDLAAVAADTIPLLADSTAALFEP